MISTPRPNRSIDTDVPAAGVPRLWLAVISNVRPQMRGSRFVIAVYITLAP